MLHHVGIALCHHQLQHTQYSLLILVFYHCVCLLLQLAISGYYADTRDKHT